MGVARSLGMWLSVGAMGVASIGGVVVSLSVMVWFFVV